MNFLFFQSSFLFFQNKILPGAKSLPDAAVSAACVWQPGWAPAGGEISERC